MSVQQRASRTDAGHAIGLSLVRYSVPRNGMTAAVALLLMADLLAFQDLFEPHTVRDWLMLTGSALAFLGLVGGSAEGLRTSSSCG